MTGGFKFDFAPSEEGEGGNGPSANTNNPGSAADIADELISKLTKRAEKNADACTLVNASSKILSATATTDNHKNAESSNSKPNNGEDNEFRPNLRFHPHESIDLHSNNMDTLRYVIPKHTLSDDTTDLIPGVYEGGLKVWECSVDLCRFLTRVIDDLSNNNDASSSSSTDDADWNILLAAVGRSLGPSGSTMELGCGHGLPGCLILRENIRRRIIRKQQENDTTTTANRYANENENNDGSVVIFTDFNDFVLHHATIPNAQLNVCGLRGEDGVAMDECRTANALVERSVFAGGDWMGLSHKLLAGSDNIFPMPAPSKDLLHPNQKKQKYEDKRFDLILASETTYTPESCEDTAFLMLRHLKINDGVGLVATKRFYFGVGGGTDLFQAACETLSSASDYEGPYSGLRLCVKVVQSYDTGNANIRDLLRVSLHQKM